MPIKIVRNEEGNCINFVGTSNPVYFNACLSAEVDPNNSNAINVINDIRTAGTSQKFYEFFNIHYTEWTKEDGSGFPNAAAVAAHITEVGNVTNYYNNTLSFDNTNLIDIRYGDLNYKNHPIITVFSVDINGVHHEIFPQIDYNTTLQRILITFGNENLSGFVVIR